MLNVNTIEFAGEKAVINSFSDHPLIAQDIKNQIAGWSARFPNAIVKTERMSDIDTMLLVAKYSGPDFHLRCKAWEIGEASNR